jgi:hypothetical protein
MLTIVHWLSLSHRVFFPMRLAGLIVTDLAPRPDGFARGPQVCRSIPMRANIFTNFSHVIMAVE